MTNLHFIYTTTIKVDERTNHYKNGHEVVKIDNHHLEWTIKLERE